MNTGKTLVILVLLWSHFAYGAVVQQVKKQKEHKNDSIVLDNGDRITGEIQKMQYGILFLKSDRATETLQLDWLRLREVRSIARYEFETMEGAKYIGVIVPDAGAKTPGDFSIRMDDGAVQSLSVQHVVGIREMNRNFLGRLNFSLDAGISFTQGNHQTETTVQTTLDYLRPHSSLRMNASSLFTSQTNGTDTSRHEGLFFAERFLSGQWGTLALLGLMHDSQLDLDLRAMMGGAARRYFAKTNRTWFAGYLGAVYTKENYTSETSVDRDNGEIMAGLGLSTYSFRGSELRGYALFYPSFTDTGRVRADVSLYWKWKIVSDLYFKTSIFDNFDNRPPTNSPENNFGVTTSVGWSF